MLSARTSGEAPFSVKNHTIEARVVKIVMCESSGNPVATGDNGKAFGLVQYHEPTFYRHAELAGLKNANYRNNEHQLTLLRWALSQKDKKWAREWSCYRKIYE